MNELARDDRLRNLLHLVSEYPTLLTAAPPEAVHDEIVVERRRKAVRFRCVVCDVPARTAYLARTVIGPRWLDLCPDCGLCASELEGLR